MTTAKKAPKKIVLRIYTIEWRMSRQTGALMILFGHIGITAGVSKACEYCISYKKSVDAPEKNPGSRIHRLFLEIRGRLGLVDYRMVVIGSILPDIIDKPVFLLFSDTLNLSGRDYAHTLVFHVILLAGGLVLLKYRKYWLFIIAPSSIMHLVLDQMWRCPEVLFWPLLGPLPGADASGWVSDRWYSLFTAPGAYIPEIIGLVILAVFTYKLVRNRQVKNFITSGVVD